MNVDLLQGTVGELLFRLVYCHLLGYDISFGFIHTIKLAQQGTGLEKRMGKFLLFYEILSVHEYATLTLISKPFIYNRYIHVPVQLNSVIVKS